MNPLDVLNTQLVRLRAWADTLFATHRDERGNVTLEQVLWAALAVFLVGLVGAALMAFIESKLAALA